MTAILNSDLFTNESLVYCKEGRQVEILESNLYRNELDMKTYQFYPIEQVRIRYPYFSWYDKTGKETILYHITEIDKSKLSFC